MFVTFFFDLCGDKRKEGGAERSAGGQRARGELFICFSESGKLHNDRTMTQEVSSAIIDSYFMLI